MKQIINTLFSYLLANKILSDFVGSLFIFLLKKKKNGKKKRSFLIAQTIFGPNDDLLEINIRSVQSLALYLNHYYPEVRLFFGFAGWTYNDDARNKIFNVIQKSFGKDVYIERFKENLGKSTYINKLVNDLKYNDFTDILTFDSDISFTLDSPFLFDRLSQSITQIEIARNQRYGIVGLNLMGGDPHVHNLQSNKLGIITNINSQQYEESIRYSKLCLGIGGGFRSINRELWEHIGGYKHFGKFGPEDTFLLLSCLKEGYTAQIITSLSVVHDNLVHKKNHYDNYKRGYKAYS